MNSDANATGPETETEGEAEPGPIFLPAAVTARWDRSGAGAVPLRGEPEAGSGAARGGEGGEWAGSWVRVGRVLKVLPASAWEEA